MRRGKEIDFLVLMRAKARAAVLASYPTDTASGDPATFPDGADGVPVKSLTVNISAVQAGSGDPSPENNRPISGWTGAVLSHSGADTSDPETVSVSWQSEAGTVYGGTLDVTTGVLTVTHGQIASYAGETLPGKWISDRDKYAAGTSPSTGAQVVYELANPETYQLAPHQVRTLLGENNLWSDAGEVAVEYRADLDLYIEKKLDEGQE